MVSFIPSSNGLHPWEKLNIIVVFGSLPKLMKNGGKWDGVGSLNRYCKWYIQFSDKLFRNKSILIIYLDDDDVSQQHKLQQLQTEMRKMQNEFNTQRAKMKDLFMQKEAERKQLQDELDELKTHLMVADLKSENEMLLKDQKAQEEISSLQQLVQDTIEESATYKAELERVKLEQLRQQQQQLQQMQQMQQPPETTGGLAPHVLNQVKKTLGSVRKLGSDSLNNSFQQENTENNARGAAKNNAKQYVSTHYKLT